MPDLTPHTSSPVFLETYVAGCVDAGIPFEKAAAHYHGLRVAEALERDGFREGFEKAAFYGGLVTKGVEAGLRGLRGVYGTLRHGAKKGFGDAFEGFKMLPTKRLFEPGVALPHRHTGSVGGKIIGSGVKDWWRSSTQLGNFGLRTTGELGLLGGGAALATGASTGANPFSGMGLGGGNPGVPPRLPDMQGAFASGAQARMLEERIRKMRLSLPPGSDLRSRVLRERQFAQINELEKARRSLVGPGTRKRMLDAERGLRQYGAKVDTALARNRERQAALEAYMARTEGSLPAKIWNRVPGVNPNARAHRLVESEDALMQARELNDRLALQHARQARLMGGM